MSDDRNRRTLWFLITALTVGGAERTLVDIANNVDTDRYDVTVWSVFDAGPLEPELRSGVTVRTLTDRGRVEDGYVVGVSNPAVYALVPLRLCYAAAVERPDILHSFLFFDNMLARLAGLVSPATVITGVRSVPNDRSALRSVADRLTTPLSDCIVSNSAAGADYVVDELGADPDDVAVVRNGRDVATYQSASGAAVASELDIGADELVVGMVGRLIERKGQYELLTAWADVQRRVPNARLVLVGGGEERTALERHAEELGCADSVAFLGQRGDVPELLAAMDVFAFPSHFEGLPGAVIEAMAAGLPIAATPVDGTAELLDEYETGLFVPVDSPEPLGWALTRLLESPDLRAALGSRARERATAEFTIAAMVEGFEAVYDGEPQAVDDERRAVRAQ